MKKKKCFNCGKPCYGYLCMNCSKLKRNKTVGRWKKRNLMLTM